MTKRGERRDPGKKTAPLPMLFDRDEQIVRHLLRGANYTSDLINAKENPLKLGTVHI